MTQQRQLLEPFPPAIIKQVNKGSYMADFVSWTDKLQRLIELVGAFDWEVQIIPGEWKTEERTSKKGNKYDARVATAGAGDAVLPLPREDLSEGRSG